VALIVSPGQMALDFVVGFDAIHDNVPHLPHGQVAGYDTGTSGIQWTAEDWATHPGAVHIDQDASAKDPESDILDVETGAATSADCAGWCKAAVDSYAAAKRPGQRHPAVYCSASNVTAVVNALIAGGVTTGVGLWVANWNLTEPESVAAVLAGSGPFPIIGVQYTDAPVFYDIDIFDGPWLSAVSGKPAPPPVAHGPYRHVTVLHQTIAELAAGRHESVASLITNSAANYTAKDILELADAKLPSGVPFYTINP
jgi:hypothetical protein